MGDTGAPLEPVRLLPPTPLTVTSKPKPETKKRKLDETTPRIDSFLEKVAKKARTKHRTVSVPFSLAECRRRQEKEAIEDRIVGALPTEKGVS